MELLRLNILILDDDPVSLEQSRQKIGRYVEERRIYTAGNSEAAMEILGRVPVNLAFIDIEMPDADGFSVADYIKSAFPRVKYVFLTGHTELGAKSYDYEPLDFLSKPVNVLRLQKTFERYRRSQGAEPRSQEQIAVESTTGFVLIKPEDILYITREHRKVLLCCRKQRYTLKTSLEELALMLEEEGLFRCHQSYLVSLRHVTGVVQSDYGRTYTACLDNGERIPVSRSRYLPLKERMQLDGTQFL